MANVRVPVTAFLLAIIAIAATIYLFFNLIAESSRSPTFGFTLAYVCFLQILFFGFIGNIRHRSRSGAQHLGATYSVLGLITAFYIVFGLVTIFAYNFVLCKIFSSTIYYSIILVGSIIAIVVYGFIGKLDTYQKISSERETNAKHYLKTFSQELELLDRRYVRALNSKFPLETPDLNISLIKELANKVKFSNPMIVDNFNFIKHFQTVVSNLKELIVRLESSELPRSDEIIKEVNSFVSNSVDELHSWNQIHLK